MYGRDRRRIGTTGLCVPDIGVGLAPLGNLYHAISDDDAAATLTAAIDTGFCYFDTAPYYGFGLSEKRLGAALAGDESGLPFMVSSKVGRVLEPYAGDRSGERFGFVDADPFTPVFDYSYDGVMRSFEESCRRLGRETIDILFAHDLGPVTHGADHERHYRTFLEGGYRAMAALRDDGRTMAIGLGVNEWQVCATAMADCDLDCCLLAGRYTLLEQEALQCFLPDCEKRRVSVIVGGPFNSGLLAGDLTTDSALHYNYAAAPGDKIARARQLQAVCRDHNVPLRAAALQFPLAHPAVASVIPGLASPAEVGSAARDIDFPVGAGLWRDLVSAGLLAADVPVPGRHAA